jgi:hypothetical protein
MDGSEHAAHSQVTPSFGIVSGALTFREASAEVPWNGMLDLFQAALPDEFFERLEKARKKRPQSRIFDLPLVIWLMIVQRLDRKATLSTAVEQVVQKRPRVLLSDHKRLREGTVSGHTGAYSDARKAMPVEVAYQVADQVFDYFQKTRREALPGFAQPVFVLDGSSLTTSNTPELVQAYPPAKRGHWPVLRILVAHELTTSVAARPCWGAMYGAQRVSEQALTEQILERLPARSVVMGDINFGVFSVAYAAAQSGHDVLLRLQGNRARAMAGGVPLISGTDQRICWKPSKYERDRHPEIAADACVRGRLIVQEVEASNGEIITLYLFTTLSLPLEQILELYGQRWDVETDLRSLKRTLNLHMLSCKSKDMIAKELVLAVTAYNFVRTVMSLAAERAGIDPRRLSYSRSEDVVNAALPGMDAASGEIEYQKRLARMLDLVASCKLPNRKRSSNERKVWRRNVSKFPYRKAAPKAG